MSTSTALRIDADHIAFTDDGHAWWVLDAVWKHRAHDEECRWCDGTMVGHAVTPWKTNLCDHCIDGRHTFEIEVDGQFQTVEDGSLRRWDGQAHRVSVVPGMVLPIHGREKTSRPREYVWLPGTGEALRATGSQPMFESITLPSVAAPGMWAVKLKVAS